MTVVDDFIEALGRVFGAVGNGETRVGTVHFSGNTSPADQPINVATPGGAAGVGTVKALSSGRLFAERVLIQNAQKDMSGNATAGNTVVVGNETEQLFELPPGGAVEVLYVDLAKVRVGYLGSVLTSGQSVFVKWIAHGRRLG